MISQVLSLLAIRARVLVVVALLSVSLALLPMVPSTGEEAEQEEAAADTIKRSRSRSHDRMHNKGAIRTAIQIRSDQDIWTLMGTVTMAPY